MDQTKLRELFESELKLKLEPLEKIRLKAVKQYAIRIIVGIILAIGTLMFVSAYDLHWMTGGFIMIFGIAVLLVFPNLKYCEYRYLYKNHVITTLIESIAPSLKFDTNEKIALYKYLQSGLYRKRYNSDPYNGEDYISGKIGGTTIEFSKLHTERLNTAQKGNLHDTVFKGIFFIADVNRHFSNETYVLADKGFISLLAEEFANKFRDMGDRVALENTTFGKDFRVYSNNEVEARDLLNPALMKRLLEFRQNNDCALNLSFINGKIFIAIPSSKDFFEPRLYEPVTSFSVFQEIFQDLFQNLNFFTGVVEDLNLNTRISAKK